MHSRHDNCCYFLKCCPGDHMMTFDYKKFKLSDIQFYQGSKTMLMHLTNLDIVLSFSFKFSKKEVITEATLSSGWLISNFTRLIHTIHCALNNIIQQAIPTAPCTARYFWSTLCISPTSQTYLCHPSLCEVPFTKYQLCCRNSPPQGRCLLHHTCQFLPYWFYSLSVICVLFGCQDHYHFPGMA